MSENKRFRVNDLVKYNYSEIGEYIDKNHTDTPLRNDELCKLLNELHEENQRLKNDCSILVQSNQEYRKENEQISDWIERHSKDIVKIGEQKATISQLEEEKEYWKGKAMTLLMQVRRLTPRMTDKEVIEFSKELEDEANYTYRGSTVYEHGEELSTIDIVDLLNEQQAIIDQLEKENKQLRKTIALFEVEEDEINFLKEVVVVDE